MFPLKNLARKELKQIYPYVTHYGSLPIFVKANITACSITIM